MICSQYLGSKDVEKANEAAGQLVFVTFFLSLIMAVVCIIFHEPVLQLIFVEVEKEVMDNAKIYFLFRRWRSRLLLFMMTVRPF